MEKWTSKKGKAKREIMGLAIANVELADGDEWMDGWVGECVDDHRALVLDGTTVIGLP